MRIAVGADDQAPVVDEVVADLRRRGHKVELFGALVPGADARWPVVATVVAERVARGDADEGVLFCHTGTGVSIAANKVPGVRAALCPDAETARGARLWNDANILCMSLHSTPWTVAEEIVDTWLATRTPDPTEQGNIQYVNNLDAARSRSPQSKRKERPHDR